MQELQYDYFIVLSNTSASYTFGVHLTPYPLKYIVLNQENLSFVWTLPQI